MTWSYFLRRPPSSREENDHERAEVEVGRSNNSGGRSWWLWRWRERVISKAELTKDIANFPILQFILSMLYHDLLLNLMFVHFYILRKHVGREGCFTYPLSFLHFLLPSLTLGASIHFWVTVRTYTYEPHHRCVWVWVWRHGQGRLG